MTEYAVISCGAAKRPQACKAYRLYTGAFFRGQWAWAAAHYPPSRIRILSALHGIITPSTIIAPYDLRMGQAGSVEVPVVADGLPADCTAIVSTVGADYAKVLTPAAEARGITVTYPFSGPMGTRLQQMKRAAGRRR